MIVLAGDLEVEVRAAAPEDVALVLRFIRSLAAHQNLTVSATEESLRDELFGSSPAACALLAFVRDEPVAYVVYFMTFSTNVARRGLFLEDLFVADAYRGQGIGEALMAYLADVAVRHGCARFEWTVLDENESAVRFYRRLGAKMFRNWSICRLDGDSLTHVAAKLRVKGEG